MAFRIGIDWTGVSLKEDSRKSAKFQFLNKNHVELLID